MGLQLTQFPRKMDANGKAAGSVEVKVFNKKVCMTADSSYGIRSERKMDANGKAAGSVELKVFNKSLYDCAR